MDFKSVIFVILSFIACIKGQEPEKVLVSDYADSFVLNPELYLRGPISADGYETLLYVRSYWRDSRTPQDSLLINWDSRVSSVVIIIWTRDNRKFQTTFQLQSSLGQGQHFVLLQMADLNKEVNRLRLFIDCQLVGEESTEVPIRDALMGMITVENNEKFTLYARVNLQEMLTFMDCDPIEAIPISTLPVLPEWVRNRNIQNLVGTTNVRIKPPVDSQEDSVRERERSYYDRGENRVPDSNYYQLSHALRELTGTIRSMQRDMQLQARETRQLHEVLRQCDMCRRQDRGKQIEQSKCCRH